MPLIKMSNKSSEMPDSPRDYMKKKRRKRRTMVADAETQAGAMDDDATKRSRKRNQMLIDAAG